MRCVVGIEPVLGNLGLTRITAFNQSVCARQGLTIACSRSCVLIPHHFFKQLKCRLLFCCKSPVNTKVFDDVASARPHRRKPQILQPLLQLVDIKHVDLPAFCLDNAYFTFQLEFAVARVVQWSITKEGVDLRDVSGRCVHDGRAPLPSCVPRLVAELDVQVLHRLVHRNALPAAQPGFVCVGDVGHQVEAPFVFKFHSVELGVSGLQHRDLDGVAPLVRFQFAHYAHAVGRHCAVIHRPVGTHGQAEVTQAAAHKLGLEFAQHAPLIAAQVCLGGRAQVQQFAGDLVCNLFLQIHFNHITHAAFDRDIERRTVKHRSRRRCGVARCIGGQGDVLLGLIGQRDVRLQALVVGVG